jgi:chromosome segregation ATPase
MKLITLLIFLSIVPSGLIAQESFADHQVKAMVELARKSYESKLSLIESSQNYKKSLENLITPLNSRLQILRDEPESQEAEIRLIERQLSETNEKIKNLETEIAKLKLETVSEPDYEAIAKKTRLDVLRSEKERAKETRQARAKPSERYYVGVFIAKEITPARKTKKPRRK